MPPTKPPYPPEFRREAVQLAQSTVGLAPGTYWLSVQAMQNFEGGAGEWGWEVREVQSGLGAVFENPGGSFNTTCTTWMRTTGCLKTTAPDQVFSLSGVASSAPQGSYTAETSTASITPGTVDIGNHCDDCTTGVSFPFPVTFYGREFTAAQASSNGNLQFGGAEDGTAFSGCPIPNQFLTGAVMPYQGNLTTTTPGDGIFTATTGSAPNRAFAIEWRAHSLALSATANFEVMFHEHSPVITTIYGATGDAGANEAAGLQGSTSGPSTTFSCEAPNSLTRGLRVDYVPNPHRLSIAKGGTGTGSVASDPEGIRCGATCSHIYYGGARVTLSAGPNADSSFAGWSGACSGNSPGCTTIIDADESVTAIFKARPPDTRIVGAKIDQKRSLAKFRLEAIGRASGFQCELLRSNRHSEAKKNKRFANCRSPRLYKHLKPGVHLFKARACEASDCDATPAKRRFAIRVGP